ncbi:RNA recognition motif domain [Macleaya cordata]|uniref:RNA recognition motif domain n=1 Tax=Macleaya cordata TaxID=56857 RepID=A0A200R611_MACCD|nr:RNA recognition motif domain [Macleaya cordata]
MDMAEKDNTEGRCPACRTSYDKEKIVGMTVKCERLVSEINSERRLKPQKVKAKASEGRKHLSSIRVIQRHLVYIIGLPSSLADEDLLQRKEYFGQYGKVLKVSISRNAGGAIQYSSNNTFSVYITYSKEDEAVRCIQSVHGFVLEDRSLRACFGTTKYCHAWLRNTPCNNPDCLYLHEVGRQEDSFSKDEIVSAYTRSRAQQITGATINMLRSGNVLPPPTDEHNVSAPSEKPIVRSVPNSSSSHVKGSPPSGASGRSISLPAAASWGSRASNGLPLTTASDCPTVPIKQNPDGCNGSFVFPSAVASTMKASTLLTDVGKKSMETEEKHVVHPNCKFGYSEICKQSMARDCKTTTHDTPEEVVQDAFSATCPPVSENKDGGVTMLLNVRNSEVSNRQPSNSASDKRGNVATDETTQRLCSGLSSIAIGSHTGTEISNANGSVSSHLSSSSLANKGLEQLYYEHGSKPFVRESVTSLSTRETARASEGVFVSRELSDWGSESLVRRGEAQEDLQDLDGPSLKFSEVGHPLHLPNSPNLLKGVSHSNGHTWKNDDSCTASNHPSGDHIAVPTKVVEASLPFRSSELLLSNGYFENNNSSYTELERTFDRPSFESNVEAGRYLGSFNDDAADVLKNSTVDMGESSIISNILSMDFDAWDVSLASPHNLAKLFSETEDGSLKVSSSRKVQSSNQSRFSFARQEDLSQGPYLEPPSSSNTGHMNKYSIHQDSVINGDLYLEKRQPGFSSYLLEESDTFPISHSVVSPSKLSVSRAPISAPPGFSVPSRATPPGFSSQERVDQTFNTSVNHLLENSFSRNQYRTQPTGSVGSIQDVEFNDPAILAVGKGMLPNGINNFIPQMRGSEHDPRLQLLMQQSISAQQNLRFHDQIGDRFSPLNDSYSIPLRNPEQFPFAQSPFQSRNVHISNGHWDGWNEVQNGNDLVLAELLRNERLGFEKYFPGHEDLKYRIPSSGDLYNRAFGM